MDVLPLLSSKHQNFRETAGMHVNHTCCHTGHIILNMTLNQQGQCASFPRMEIIPLLHSDKTFLFLNNIYQLSVKTRPGDLTGSSVSSDVLNGKSYTVFFLQLIVTWLDSRGHRLKKLNDMPVLAIPWISVFNSLPVFNYSIPVVMCGSLWEGGWHNQ